MTSLFQKLNLSVLSYPYQGTLVAQNDECALICKRLDIKKIENLTVVFTIEKTETNLYHLKATLCGDIYQEDAHLNLQKKPVKEIFEEIYMYKALPKAQKKLNETFSYSDQKKPDSINNEEVIHEILHGPLEIGEVAVQYLSLSIDPHIG